MLKPKPLLTILLILSSLVFGREGITYSHIDYPSVHIIEIDPDLYELKPVKATDHGLGRESVLSIAQKTAAIAAINGGFFAIGGTFDGRACGALKIKDWIALPNKPRGCIGWSSQNDKFYFDRLLVTIECSYKQRSFSVDGLNRARNLGEMILFTPIFNQTTLTSADGEELLIKEGIILAINKMGNSTIPNDSVVLSIQKEHFLFGTFQVGNTLITRFTIKPQEALSKPQDWESCDYIVGGTPLLIHHGEKIKDFSSELTLSTFIFAKHARSAIGILPGGHWVFVTVDKIGFWDGMTIDELTDLMSSLGCVYALNLDGGGSSTLVYENEVKNSPFGDKDEGLGEKTLRKVSDAIIAIPKNN